MTGLDRAALLEAAGYVDSWIAFRREQRDVPGLVVAIRQADELVLCQGYGCARLDPRVPMTPDHVFRVASHSKMFTATAIMQLVEQGKLRLDDRADAYISWLTSEVTLRQLLNHAGGVIRDGVDADFWRVEQPFPDVATLRTLAPDATILPPNTTFKYSNIGFGLLGQVVESVSGASFNQYAQEHIVQRLGLASTGPELVPDVLDRCVTGYTGKVLGVPRRGVPTIDTRALSPATGFYSTAEDLCRFAAAHWPGDETLLADASKREMQHAAWTIEHSEERYGLGLIAERIGERDTVGHSGGFPGQSTRTLFDPVDRLAVVVLSNTSDGDGRAGPLAAQIVRFIDFAQRHPGGSGADLAPYTGRFANAGGAVDIVAFGGKLFGLSPESENPSKFVWELEVIDADTLRIAKCGGFEYPGESIRFERDAAGNTQRMIAGGVSLYPEAIFRERYATESHWRPPAFA
ncbi:MAG TPA: serine hydrolase domain-containing protein [Chloroflexota bacterium]|jgi:CubicO group peptidase (beta-lactamase class C family)